MNVNDPDITEENYMRVITARLRVCLRLPRSVPGFWLAYAGGGEGPTRLWALSRHCFQLIDDLLDYNADGEQLGKNVATI